MAKKSSEKVSTVKGKKKIQDVPELQTTGALNPTNPAKLLTELLNRGKASPFGSYSTLAEYSAALRGMTNAEMHKHAVEDVEIVPIDDKKRLIERLEKEFANYQAKTNPQRPYVEALSAERRSAIEQIMERAKNRY